MTMKKDYNKLTIRTDKQFKTISIDIRGMTQEARKRLSNKLLNDEPIHMEFFEIE